MFGGGMNGADFGAGDEEMDTQEIPTPKPTEKPTSTTKEPAKPTAESSAKSNLNEEQRKVIFSMNDSVVKNMCDLFFAEFKVLFFVF